MNHGNAANNFGGRKLDPVRDQYCSASIPSKRRCLHCITEVSDKCIRLRAHISKCTSIPSQITENESEFVSNPKLTSNAATIGVAKGLLGVAGNPSVLASNPSSNPC